MRFPYHLSEDDLILMIKELGPFAYTFVLPLLKPNGRSTLSLHESVEAYNFVIKYLNRKLFGSKWKQRNQHITGFCSIEDHIADGVHFHSLISYDRQMFVEGKPTFSEHFDSATDILQRKNPIKGNHQTYRLVSKDHRYCNFIRRDAVINQQGVFDPEVYDDARYVIKTVNKPLRSNRKRYERWYLIEENGINLTEV